MRKILFRAKSVNTNEWIKSMTIANGTIKRKERNFYFEIAPEKFTEVIEKTIGQFTGFKDKNGNEIFELDIINFQKHKGYNLNSFVAKVIWCESDGAWGYEINGYEYLFCSADELQHDILNHCQIIGNVFDNPELMCA